ncbi:Protein CBG25492 [Caenorhabditis briggsae]|uniref:Protein CBG25492 n=1 Tax=Caenorhabditis briggsae TaxID=6238 RepID=B6IIW7_CAEBR|nr:Protein CBG25492 [Caenorhabditis briggsae]CAR99847.1 Protein CBG25492 [Caenorhabditis briggsae]
MPRMSHFLIDDRNLLSFSGPEAPPSKSHHHFQFHLLPRLLPINLSPECHTISLASSLIDKHYLALARCQRIL